MKTVVYTTLVCVLFSVCVYTFMYYMLVVSGHFGSHEENKIDILDCLMLSVTLQSGVGFSPLYPRTKISKIVVISQQFFLIVGNFLVLLLLFG